jgi:serine/threonine-protein kinase
MATSPNAPKASETPPLAVKIGDVVLERYRVVEQIAAGGHSVVFRGQDERLSRPVCIKVFSGMGGNSGVGRTSYEHFVQEAFALSRLTHPNTLRIYDFGHLGPKDAGGMPLQVCEYMNGGTLSQIIREHGKQSLAETGRLVTAMCLALGEAHGLGIVHRDIKPQNILFGTVGGNKLPKLADFGIAKWSADDDNDDDQRAEDTAVVAGQKLAMYSPSWAAPEQLAGQPVSPSTDIYSLACVAAYMLSGKAIFADEDVYAGYRKRRQGDKLLREALEPLEVPEPVIQLLARAIAFDPKQRLGDVEAMARDLAAAVATPVARADDSTDDPVETDELPALSRQPRAASGPIPAIARPAPPPHPPAHAAPPVLGDLPAHTPPPQPFLPAPPPAPTSWAPPPAVQPWMTAPASAMTQVRPAAPIGGPGLARRLPLSDIPLLVGDRRTHYIHALGHVADLAGPHSSKVRVTFQSGPTGARVLHVKGMTCFVALLGGRPSPAVQISHASDIALVTPRAQELGHLRVAIGSTEPGQTVFPLGGELVAIAADDCSDAILFDFGPGSEAYFVYTRGRPVPKSRRG